MHRHQTTGRWQLGFALALVPAVLWGTLPIALKLLLTDLSACTVAWCRFVGAATVLALALGLHGSLPRPWTMGRSALGLLALACLGLAGNYYFWTLSVQHVSPATSAVVVQCSAPFLAAGAMLIYRERFSRLQWFGFAILLSGLALFFRDGLATLLSDPGRYWLGASLAMLSSFVWVFYALSQKQLLVSLPSQGIMVMVYAGSSLVLLPGVHVSQLAALSAVQVALLAYCVLNTLVAYGALAEALDHWEASSVSAVLPLSPLFTLLFMSALSRWLPGVVAPERLSVVGVVGALGVVSGAMLTALGGQRG